ncbi:MAG: succinylglutamate desuccinylase [Gammaproteobacteria bacterium]|nr:succinylglutamate desuccinylase [Gammaproteobacteria bacterium]
MQEDLNKSLVENGFLELTKKLENKEISPLTFKNKNNTKFTLATSGVLKVEPEHQSNSEQSIDLIISSGVHGNETAPIEIVDRLVAAITSGNLPVKNRVLFIIGNPVAMNKGERFDIENMNRLFNGKHVGKDHHEAERAKLLESLVQEFYESGDSGERRHYDLHTAIRSSKYKKFAVYPYPDGRSWNKQQLEFFLASDISTVLLGHQPAGTFSYFTSHKFNAHGFTVELGKVKPFGENDASEFDAIESNLRKLIAGDSVRTKPFENNDFKLFQVIDELVKKSEKFELNIADDVENFSDFQEGFVLASDEGADYIVQKTGDAIVFPNANIPVGQRAGLIVRRVDI